MDSLYAFRSYLARTGDTTGCNALILAFCGMETKDTIRLAPGRVSRSISDYNARLFLCKFGIVVILQTLL